MSGDFPDGWDIVRPVHGAIRHYSGSTIMIPDTPYRLINIEGKGIIYGGTMYADDTASSANSGFYAVVDGQTLFTQSFASMLMLGVHTPLTHPMYLICFDETNYLYVVGLFPNITFEESFQIWFDEQHTRSPVATRDIMYSLIS